MWKLIASVNLLLALSTSLAGQSSAEVFVDSMISLERSECFGTCPNYKVTIWGDGRLIYEGIKYVKTEGTITAKVATKQFQELMAAFRKAKYFKLRDSYAYEKDGCTAMVSDEFWAYTTIQINSRKKSIRHYMGCYEGSDKFNLELQRLTELENKIDEIIKIEQWIGTKEERNKFQYFIKVQ